jgi:hypothetical protein
MQQTNHGANAVPYLAYHNDDMSAKVSTMPEWPPSIRTAADNVRMNGPVAQIDNTETVRHTVV